MAIFAEQLTLVLLRHGLKISSLSRYAVHPVQLQRLRQAASGDSTISATLNPVDLEKLRIGAPLDEHDMERLNAALMGEAVWRMYLDRVNAEQADQFARSVFDLVLEQMTSNRQNPPRERPSIFVSHSSRDSTQALQLAVDLRSAGATVWIDMENIEHGDFMARINEGLSKSKWLVLAVTPAALGSSGVAMEVNAALELVRQGDMNGVIPFILQRFDASTMPPLWRTLHRYDATSNYQNALAKLSAALGLG